MLLKKKIIVKNKITAIIPARGNSKRFPKKNIAKFLNKPLISYPITEALKSKVFSNVIVSSDNEEIIKASKKYGANVIKRSKKNSSDAAHELEACREYFFSLSKNGLELPEYFCVIYPTAVLLKAKDFKNSFKLIKLNKKIDVVMGVSKYNYHPYKAMSCNKDGLLHPIFPEKTLQRSQKYKDMYCSNGTFYWHKTKCFLEKKYLGHYAQNIVGYLLKSNIPMDIDRLEDLNNLKAYFKNRKNEF